MIDPDPRAPGSGHGVSAAHWAGAHVWSARLEGANKTCGTKTLITEAVHDRVKGASTKLEQIRKLFEGGLAAYRR